MSARVAVVTGGAGGIGTSIVDALRESGHHVVEFDRVGRDAVDLADPDQVRAASRRVLHEHGRCDVLVHAAAAFDQADLASVTLDGWRRVQALNVEAALVLTQEFAPEMARRAFGRIVFIVSDTVWSPPAPELLAYITSKAALVGMTRSLAASLGRSGIAVTGVAPGLTDTAAAHAGTPDEAFDAVVGRQALPRPLEPADVASTVAFLASDGAAALTGQILCTDGGFVLR